MHLHDYIISSQNKQDNSRLGKRRAASFFILRGVWKLSITYCLLVLSERACPQAQCKHKATSRPT